MGRLRQSLLLCLLAVLMLAFSVSCDKTEKRNFYNKFSYDVNPDTGWVFTFQYQYFPDLPEEDPRPPVYLFQGVNLRYAYPEKVMQDAEAERPERAIQLYGAGEEEDIRRDMSKIAEVLKYNRSERPFPEELLKCNSSALSLETAEASLFFPLMEETLQKPQREYAGKYEALPSYALFSEPEFTDGFKFQVGFRCGNGYVDVLFLDVLYQTGDRFNQYTQLYDLVKSGNASEDRKQLYARLEIIQTQIVENNDFCYGEKENRALTIGDVSLERLYVMLENIVKGNTSAY